MAIQSPHPHFTILKSTLFLATLTHVALCATTQYPLSSQAPHIAFVGQPYNWSFSPSSFIPEETEHDQSALSYNVTHLPAWASFDSSKRVISGTPGSTDVTTTTVRVYASETGSSTSMSSFQLIVSNSSLPHEVRSLAGQFTSDNKQISSVTVVPADEGSPGVQIKSEWSFSIGLAWDTYVSTTGGTIYYTSTLESGDPLPEWLIFDPEQVTFGGVTPSSSSDQVPLVVVLHAAEQPGFSASQDTFFINVLTAPLSGGYQPLLDISPLAPINVTAGEEFSVDFTRLNFRGINLDGVTIGRDDISTIAVQTMGIPWLSYNSSSDQLEGTPPLGLLHSPPIILPLDISTRQYNATIATNISIVVYPSAFSNPIIPSLFFPPKSRIFFDLNDHTSNATDLIGATGSPEFTATFSPRQASEWMVFSPTSNLLTGTVPPTLNYTAVAITFHATSLATNSLSSAQLILNVSPNPANTVPENGMHDLSHRNAVTVGVPVGVVSAIVLACLAAAIYVWKSRRAKSARLDPRFEEDVFVRTFDVPDGTNKRGSAVTSAGHPNKMEECNYTVQSDAAKTRDVFETVMLGPMTEASSPASRPLSVRSIGLASVTSMNGKITKGAFFQKLKVLSERSVNDLDEGLDTPSARPGSGKENGFASIAPLAYRRPLNHNAIQDDAASVGLELQGFRDSAVAPFQPIIRRTSSRSVQDRIAKQARTVPGSRSLQDMIRLVEKVDYGRSLTPAISSRTGGSGIYSEGGETLEGGIDRASWAEEPDFVWATAKIVKTSPTLEQARVFPLQKIPRASVGSSLDSVIPKRRRDFGPPRLVTPLAISETQSQASIDEGNLSIEAQHSCASLVSSNSATGVSTVISTVTQLHVVGIVSPKANPVNVKSLNSVGVEPGPRVIPRLVQFSSEYKRSDSTTIGEHRSVSHSAVVSNLEESVKVATSALPIDTSKAVAASPGTLDADKLGLGLNYVRAFGLDEEISHLDHGGKAEQEALVASTSSAIHESFSKESFGSKERSVSGRQFIPGQNAPYGYHHRNDDISGRSSGRSPSLASSLGSTIPSPGSVYTTSTHPQPFLASELLNTPQTSNSDTSSPKLSSHRFIVSAGQPFNFSIPLPSSRGDGTKLEARREDGKTALPDWLRFDEKQLEFWGVPPREMIDEAQSEFNIVGVSLWQKQQCLSSFVVEIALQS